jgi:hypothetical protein
MHTFSSVTDSFYVDSFKALFFFFFLKGCGVLGSMVSQLYCLVNDLLTVIVSFISKTL